jgi:hypothetical protein
MKAKNKNIFPNDLRRSVQIKLRNSFMYFHPLKEITLHNMFLLEEKL